MTLKQQIEELIDIADIMKGELLRCKLTLIVLMECGYPLIPQRGEGVYNSFAEQMRKTLNTFEACSNRMKELQHSLERDGIK